MIEETIRHERSAYGASPWDIRERMALLLWQVLWPTLCGWTPKPFNGWRVFLLRRFGMKIGQKCFVHSRARIQKPWNVEMADGACVGDRANLYSLGRIYLGAECIVAQEAYLCTGTHSREQPGWPLVTAPIRVGRRAFVGARAFVLPGVHIGEETTVGACAVVTRDVPPRCVVVGNPARLKETKTVSSNNEANA